MKYSELQWAREVENWRTIAAVHAEQLERSQYRNSELQEEIAQLRSTNKRLLITNLDYALTVAESDPIFMEDLRPYFKRIHEALA